MKCSGISIKRICEIAKTIRTYYNVKDVYFPIVEIVDEGYSDGLFDFEILDDNTNILKSDEVAKYDFNTNTIYIKESSYKECLENIGRSRFTLTHEFSHYILFKIEGIKILEGDITKAYEDPEWQANTLAAELLAPKQLTNNYSVDLLMEKCGVSEEFAIVQVKKRHAKPYVETYNDKQVIKLELNIIDGGCLVEQIKVEVLDNIVQSTFNFGRMSPYGVVTHDQKVSKRIIDRLQKLNYDYYKQFKSNSYLNSLSEFNITFSNNKELEICIYDVNKVTDKSIFKFIDYICDKHSDSMYSKIGK